MKRPMFALVLSLLAIPALGQEVWRLGPNGEQGYLGVQLRDVTAKDVPEANLPSETGAVVAEVVPDSPAEAAGMSPGDVVVEVAGLPVLSARHLQRIVSDNPPGRTLDVKVYRNGVPTTLTVKLGERSWPGRRGSPGLAPPRMDRDDPDFEREGPPFFEFHRNGPGIRVFGNRPRLGVQGHGLTPQLAQALKLPVEKGILVLEVSEDSPADEAGLQAGDVILSVSGAAVEDIDDLRKALREDSVDLEIQRGQSRLTLSVKL